MTTNQTSLMAMVLALLCFVLCAEDLHAAEQLCPDKGVYVVGDSLSSTTVSWPMFLEREYCYNVRLDAQAGRKSIDYRVPHDLNNWYGAQFLDGHKVAVYALGSNDRNVLQLFKSSFNVDTYTLLQYGFNLVVVLPLDLPALAQHRAYVQKWCDISNYFGQRVVCVDFADWTDITDPAQYPDGVHPTRETSAVIANEMYYAIEEAESL